MKKHVIGVLIVVMVMNLFTACGKSEETIVPKAESKTEEKTDTTEEEGISEGAAEVIASEPEDTLEGIVTINVQNTPGATQGFQAVADAYMAKHPNVEVVVDLKPAEGYDQWIKNQFSLDAPTADIVNRNMAGPAATDKAINLLEYVTMDSPYSDGMWQDQFNFEMQPKDAKGEWDNMSLESVQVLWFYNQGIFDEVGVKPPTTWNELIEISEKLLAAGYQPIASGGDFKSFWVYQLGWLSQVYMDQTTREMIEVYRAQPGDYNYDPEIDGAFVMDTSDPFNDDSWKVNTNMTRAFKAIADGEYRGDSVGMKTVYNNFAEVFPKYAGGDAFFGTSYEASIPLFYQGKAAMLLDGGWRISQYKIDMDMIDEGQDIMSGEAVIENPIKFDMGTFNMPSMEGEGIVAKSRTIEVPLGSIGAVKKDKAHDELVVDFLMYFSSSEGYGLYMEIALNNGWSPAGPPLVYDVLLPEEFAVLYANTEFIGNSQKGAGNIIARGVPGDVQESLRDWYTYSQKFFEGSINIDEWAKEHQANIMKYLDDALAAMKISRTDLENPGNEPTGE